MDLDAGKIVSKIEQHADILAFLYQITQKDIAYAQSTGYWSQLNLTQKIEMVADIIGGRTIGFNPFPQVANYPATFNLGNAINKTSELGALLWILSEADVLPSKWGTIGKKILVGGAVGGVFDAPVEPTSQTLANTSDVAQLNAMLVRR